MLKELMNHNILGVKFYKDENQNIFVEDEKIGIPLKLKVYENVLVFHRDLESIEAINRHIEIAKNYDEMLKGTWKPEPVEEKFNFI